MDSEQIEQLGSVWNGFPAEFDDGEDGPMVSEVKSATSYRKLAIRADRSRTWVSDDP